MPYYIGIGILAILFAFWVFIKLLRSPKYEGFVKEITEEKGYTRDRAPKDSINRIESEKAGLRKKSELDEQKAKELQEQASTIKEYLGDEKGGKAEAETGGK